ncbi:MAG: hypothetical protein PHT19_17430 [Methylococcus sp.]|nr:hypothetical protein [Methylococcus sp.]
MKWATKNYNALGNFLHAPSIYQMEGGKKPDMASIKTRAIDIANECEQLLSSSIYDINIGQFVGFECVECKAYIKKRIANIDSSITVICYHCRANYKLEKTEDGATEALLCESTYKCQKCGHDNHFGSHRVVDGAILKCTKCGNQTKIQQQFFLCDPKTGEGIAEE